MAHPDTVRGPIELAHNKTRDDREKAYVAARVALEDTYHTDLQAIQTAKEAALVAAGLNPDGGVPSDYPRPVNTVAPAITGTPTTGQVLTVSNGTWTEADSYTYQWYRDGVAITGATAATHTLVVGDEGKALKARVTAHDADSTTSKDSNVVTPHA